jgi:hypothetical protein
MSLKFNLEMCNGKEINIIMDGSGSALHGELVAVDICYFIMKTRWSDRQIFDMQKLQSFWCTEDKLKDNE